MSDAEREQERNLEEIRLAYRSHADVQWLLAHLDAERERADRLAESYRVQCLTIEQMTVEAMRLEATINTWSSHLIQVSDWDGPASGTVEKSCRICGASWHGGIADSPVIQHAPECFLAASSTGAGGGGVGE